MSNYLAKSNASGTAVVCLGFVLWLGAASLLPESDWRSVISYSIAGFGFFLVGCFLPERRDKRCFVSRRSALQLMAFFFWLADSALGFTRPFKELAEVHAWLQSMQAISFIVVPVGTYFVAHFLIRGLRAQPEYADEEEEKNAEQIEDGDTLQRPC